MSKVWQRIALSCSRSHWSLVPWYTEMRPLRRSLPSTWRSWPQPTLRHNSTFYPSGRYLVWKTSMGPAFPAWLTLIDSYLDDCRLETWPAGDFSELTFQPEFCISKKETFPTGGMRGRLLVMRLWSFLAFQKWAHWSDFVFCTHLSMIQISCPLLTWKMLRGGGGC